MHCHALYALVVPASLAHTVTLLLLQALGDAANDPVDIGDVEDLSAALTDSSLDGLIVGAPTWNTGDCM